MEVVYYFDCDLNICPVKKYFESLLPNNSDTYQEKEKKINTLATIDEKIRWVRDNPGRQASFLSTLHNHSFIEIKNGKDKNTVIRILYFIFSGKVVLLNAFEKPNKYDTDKIRKDIEKKYYKITDIYVNNFKKRPNQYEQYE